MPPDRPALMTSNFDVAEGPPADVSVAGGPNLTGRQKGVRLARMSLEEFPRIISVDDHVVEPPNLWQDRLAAAMKERGPKVVFAPKGDVTFVGGRADEAVGRPRERPGVPWGVFHDLEGPLIAP